jgi:tetratricopeptide (TPR) repeat protein
MGRNYEKVSEGKGTQRLHKPHKANINHLCTIGANGVCMAFWAATRVVHLLYEAQAVTVNGNVMHVTFPGGICMITLIGNGLVKFDCHTDGKTTTFIKSEGWASRILGYLVDNVPLIPTQPPASNPEHVILPDAGGPTVVPRYEVLFELGRRALKAFELGHDRDQLDEAIRWLECAAADNADAAGRLRAEAELLLNRDYLNGLSRSDHRDWSSDEGQSNLVTAHDAQQLGGQLEALGTALLLRYQLTSEILDLMHAHSTVMLAVDCPRASTADRSRRLDILGVIYWYLYERFMLVSMLDEAVEAHAEALGLNPSDPEVSTTHANLGWALLTRYRHKRQAAAQARTSTSTEAKADPDQDDLDQALAHLRDAIGHVPDGGSPRPLWLNNLGSALLELFMVTDVQQDLDEAISHCRHAVDLARQEPCNDVDLAGYLLTLAQCLGCSLMPEARQESWDTFRSAASLTPTAPAWQVKIARTWADAAVHVNDWAVAAQAFELAIRSLAVVTAADSPGHDIRHALGESAFSLASEAAACAVECGSPERAVEILEGARAVLLAGRSVETRTDGLPRQELPFSELIAASNDGPVVIINVARWRCDALLVTMHGVRLVRLPHLTHAEVLRHASSYFTCLEELASAGEAYIEGRGPHPPTSLTRDLAETRMRQGSALEDARDRVEDGLLDLLAWLWEVMAEPVLDELGWTDSVPDGMDPLRQVWWSPTGLLTLLPVPAAGKHSEPGMSILDRAVSSVAPTLRCLLEARRSGTVAPGGPFLFVGTRTAETAAVRKSVDRQQAIVTTMLSAEQITLLLDEDATVEAVRSALAGHPYVHFGCHGHHGWIDPGKGRLKLADGPLTVEAIAAQGIQGEFAFLAACKGATGGHLLADEWLSLAGALHFGGYRHVIAALWDVQTEAAADISNSLYSRMSANGVLVPERSALALHQTLRAQRQDRPDEPTRWALFSHYGP